MSFGPVYVEMVSNVVLFWYLDPEMTKITACPLQNVLLVHMFDETFAVKSKVIAVNDASHVVIYYITRVIQ